MIRDIAWGRLLYEVRGFIPGRESISSLLHRVQTALGLLNTPVQWVPELFARV
jgi:hypothetical protein